MSHDCASSNTRLHHPPRQSRILSPTFNPELIGEVAQSGRTNKNVPASLVVGTGYSIYHNSIIPAIRTAQSEVILVTCFWATSATRHELGEALRILSRTALSASTTISVQICFSSSSLVKNLLWPTPSSGQVYPPQEWNTKLGLPCATDLAGLHLEVRRKFFWPFGIWHSKYLIIDRELAIFPSCNVSWERWYEVALPVRGPVVEHLRAQHTKWWSSTVRSLAEPRSSAPSGSLPNDDSNAGVYTTLLPSPHTPSLLPRWLRPRRFAALLPCFGAARPIFPPTPLLTTIHHLLSSAQRTIVLLTPNVTEPHVINLLTLALERGVDVFIYTDRTLMTLEQIVIAGTTTPRCVKALKRRHSRMPADTRGHFEVLYFDDLAVSMGAQQKHTTTRAVVEADKETTPIKLHAKVTMVDDQYILLGSGNMDSASWQTSQELGVLVESTQVVKEMMSIWEKELARLRGDTFV